MFLAGWNPMFPLSYLISLLEVVDSAGQYFVAADDLRFEPNMPYKNRWEPEDGWKVAPHHVRGRPVCTWNGRGESGIN